MVIDGTTLPADELLEADVCIVGAGPSGITLALELIDSGMRVCVLESGGKERTREAQRLLDGESVGHPYPRLRVANVSAFGGSSHHWGLGAGEYWHARPLDRIDFEEREAVPHSGWPFGRDELSPFYMRAERIAGLTPFDYGTTTTDVDASRVLPVRPGRLVTGSLLHGVTDFAAAYERIAGADDVRLLLRSHVAELLPDEGDTGAIAGVRALSAPERSFRVHARATVLAAGGIGNARLLLIGNQDHPSGIGNRHDLVGRFFMEHPAFRSGVVVPADPALVRRQELSTLTDVDGYQARPTLALSEDVLRDEGLLNTYFLLEPRPRSFTAEGVRSLAAIARGIRSRPRAPYLARRLRTVGADLPAITRALLASRLGADDEVTVVRIQSEQAPNPDSRITLSDSVDPLGVRTPRLDWRLLPRDTDSIRRSQEILGHELRVAGLGRLDDLLGDERPPALISGIYHNLGTTRMHANPHRGVVDPSSRVHGIPNLYVTGGSVFPTSGAANPTLTIMALAVRLADRLLAALAGHIR